MEERRFDEAISEFYKYIEIYPHDLNGYSYCASACMTIGQLEEANKLLHSAIITKDTSLTSKENLIRF